METTEKIYTTWREVPGVYQINIKKNTKYKGTFYVKAEYNADGDSRKDRFYTSSFWRELIPERPTGMKVHKIKRSTFDKYMQL